MDRKRLMELMNEKHISQDRLAKLSAMSQGTISNILHGKVSPKEDTVGRLAAALGVTVSELVGENEQLVTGDDLTPVERKLVQDFRLLNHDGQEHILRTMSMAVMAFAGESGAVSFMASAR